MAAPLLSGTLLIRASSAPRTTGSTSAGCLPFTKSRRLRIASLANVTCSSTLLGETKIRSDQGGSQKRHACGKADPVKAPHPILAHSGERVEGAAFSDADMRLHGPRADEWTVRVSPGRRVTLRIDGPDVRAVRYENYGNYIAPGQALAQYKPQMTGTLNRPHADRRAVPARFRIASACLYGLPSLPQWSLHSELVVRTEGPSPAPPS